MIVKHLHYHLFPKTPLFTLSRASQTSAWTCCEDLRPLSVVSGIGFKSLAQELINVGSTFGRVPVETVLPHYTTVSKACTGKAEVRRSLLIEREKKTLASSCDVAMSTVMWTDDYRKMSYIAITCHFTETEFNLVGRTLTTAVFSSRRRQNREEYKKRTGPASDEYIWFGNFIFIQNSVG